MNFMTAAEHTSVNLTASYAFGGKNAYEIYNIFDEDIQVHSQKEKIYA